MISVARYTTIGPYQLEEVLYERMFEGLYLARSHAEDTSKQAEPRRVWLKAFAHPLTTSPRFLRSVRRLNPLLAELAHPSIPTLQDPLISWKVQDLYRSQNEEVTAVVTTMTAQSGQSLAVALHADHFSPLPARKAAAMIAGLCDALHHLAHANTSTGQTFPHRPGVPGPSGLWLTSSRLLLLDFLHLGPIADAYRHHALTQLLPELLAYLQRQLKRPLSSPYTLTPLEEDLALLGIYLLFLTTGVRPEHWMEGAPGLELDAAHQPHLQLAHTTRGEDSLPPMLRKLALRALGVSDEGPFSSLQEFGQALQTWLEPTTLTLASLLPEDALGWTRERTYEDDLSSLEALLSQRPELCSPALTSYIWSHIQERLLAPLRTAQPLPYRDELLLNQLPQAADELLDLLQSPELEVHSREHICRLLSAHPTPAVSAALVSALNDPALYVRAAAREALMSFSKRPQIAASTDSPLLRACPHEWDELPPHEDPRLRFCKRCDAMVAKLESLDALRPFTAPSSPYFAPLPQAALRPIHLRRQFERWTLSLGESFLAGSATTSPFTHPTLAPIHARISWKLGGRLRIQALHGDLFVNGIHVQEITLTPTASTEQVVELGMLVLRYTQNEFRIFGEEPFWTPMTDQSPRLAFDLLRTWDDVWIEAQENREFANSTLYLPAPSSHFFEAPETHEQTPQGEQKDTEPASDIWNQLQDILLKKSL